MIKVFSYFAPSKDTNTDTMLSDARHRWCVEKLETDVNKFMQDKKWAIASFHETFDPVREGLQMTATVSFMG